MPTNNRDLKDRDLTSLAEAVGVYTPVTRRPMNNWLDYPRHRAPRFYAARRDVILGAAIGLVLWTPFVTAALEVA